MARATGKRKARLGVLAGAATAALLAFPGAASAAVTSSVAGGALTVNSDAGDTIAITCVANQVKVNGGNPGPRPRWRPATRSPRSSSTAAPATT